MKLIVEYEHDGSIYAYFEKEKHHKKSSVKQCRKHLKRLMKSDLDKECKLSTGHFICVDVKGKL